MDFLTQEVDLILSDPSLLLIMHLGLLFAAVISYVLKERAERRSENSTKKAFSNKLSEAARRYKIYMTETRNPFILFIALFALVTYNIIAWFVRDQLDREYFDMFYEFYTGFVVFLIIWVSWIQIASFASTLFFNKHPHVDPKRSLKEGSAKVLLKYMLYNMLVYHLTFPLLMFIVIFIVYPRPFFIGILLVLLMGVVQNMLNYISLAKR